MSIPKLLINYENVLKKVIKKHNLNLPSKIIRISYDEVADILEIDFSNDEVAYSDPVGDGVIIEYDMKDDVIGIVIENASKYSE
ncbi:MAG: DUF2283 domain-containing protein [Candidatus Asgardarchaeia archaeon]